MRLPPLVRGHLITRDNRFRAQVDVDGRSVPVHVANPGRCLELLVPDCAVWLEPAAADGR